MTTVQMETKLLAEKMRWEITAAHVADQVTTDSQCNFQFRKAQEKQAALARTQQRLADGTFGRCDRCGALIEEERLELLFDSDCHTCAVCAKVAGMTNNTRSGARNFHTTHRRSARMRKMA